MQAAARQVMACAYTAAAAASGDPSRHSTAMAAAASVATSADTAEAPGRSAGTAASTITGTCLEPGSSSSSSDGSAASATVRVPTAAEADQQLAAGLAAAAAGDLLYLLRALTRWQWEGGLHGLLLPAAVAALQGKAADMQLQVGALARSWFGSASCMREIGSC